MYVRLSLYIYRAVLQFYPENEQQIELVSAVAQRCGFTGGLVVDFPNSTKAKKYYLTLFAGNTNDSSSSSSSSSTNISSKHTHIPSTMHGLSSITNNKRHNNGPTILSDTSISLSSSSANNNTQYNDDEDEENEYTNNSSSSFQFGRNNNNLSSSSNNNNPNQIPMEMRRARHKISKHKNLRVNVKSKAWIQAKKETTARKTGTNIKPVTKYTGRKRKPKF